LKRTFVETQLFSKQWRELGLGDEELRKLQTYLSENSHAGDMIQGTGGAIKLRWELHGSSKRDGMRVIYIDLINTSRTHLITCYAKPKKDTLTAAEKAIIKDTIKRITSPERGN